MSAGSAALGGGRLRVGARGWGRERVARVALYSTIVILLVLTVIGPYIGPFGPEEVDPDATLRPPDGTHWLGTDTAGMDIFSRILAAFRINLLIAVVATGISVGVGMPLGAMAGYFSRQGVAGVLSDVVMRTMDVLQSFPVFIFAMVLVSVRGPSIQNVIAAMALVNVPVFVRLARSEMLVVREQPYAEAARCLGHSNGRIIFRHLLPNALSSGLAQVPVVIGFVILFTASLSFVGAGVRPPTPELGSMIAIGAGNMVTGEWWPSVFPGIVLGVTVLVFALAARDLGVRIRRSSRGRVAVAVSAEEVVAVGQMDETRITGA